MFQIKVSGPDGINIYVQYIFLCDEQFLRTLIPFYKREIHSHARHPLPVATQKT
jgi:hypothetical protein